MGEGKKVAENPPREWSARGAGPLLMSNLPLLPPPPHSSLDLTSNTNSKIKLLRISRQQLQSVKPQGRGPSKQEVLCTSPGQTPRTRPSVAEERVYLQSQARESGLSKGTRKQVLIKIRALTRLGRPVNPNLLWRKTEYFILATSPNRQKKATKLES